MQATITNEQIMTDNDTSIEINISEIGDKYPLIAKVIGVFLSGDFSDEKIVDRDLDSYSDYILDVKLKSSRDGTGFTLYSKITEKVKLGDQYAKNIDFIHIKASKIGDENNEIELNMFNIYLISEGGDNFLSGKYDLIKNWDSFKSQKITDADKLFIPSE